MYAYLSRRYHWLYEEFTSRLLLFFVPDDADTVFQNERAPSVTRVLCVEWGLQGVHIQPGAIYTHHIENIPPYSPHPPFNPNTLFSPIHHLIIFTL